MTKFHESYCVEINSISNFYHLVEGKMFDFNGNVELGSEDDLYPLIEQKMMELNAQDIAKSCLNVDELMSEYSNISNDLFVDVYASDSKALKAHLAQIVTEAEAILRAEEAHN